MAGGGQRQMPEPCGRMDFFWFRVQGLKNHHINAAVNCRTVFSICDKLRQCLSACHNFTDSSFKPLRKHLAEVVSLNRTENKDTYKGTLLSCSCLKPNCGVAIGIMRLELSFAYFVCLKHRRDRWDKALGLKSL